MGKTRGRVPARGSARPAGQAPDRSAPARWPDRGAGPVERSGSADPARRERRQCAGPSAPEPARRRFARPRASEPSSSGLPQVRSGPPRLIGRWQTRPEGHPPVGRSPGRTPGPRREPPPPRPPRPPRTPRTPRTPGPPGPPRPPGRARGPPPASEAETSRSCRPPPKSVEGDLIEVDGLDPRLLTLVIAAALLLEALQRLAVARRIGQFALALDERLLAPVQVLLGRPVGLLGPLQVRLAAHELQRAGGRARGVQLGRARGGHPLGGLLHLALAARAIHHRAGERLLGSILVALAQCAHPLEAKSKRGTSHAHVVGRPTGAFNAMDAYSTHWPGVHSEHERAAFRPSAAQSRVRVRATGWPTPPRRARRRLPAARRPPAAAPRAANPVPAPASGPAAPPAPVAPRRRRRPT